MQFNQDFWSDVEEAFQYWQSMQAQSGDTAARNAALQLTPVTWAAQLLANPVYRLIGEKRAFANSIPSPEPEELDGEEKGRQVPTDSH
jgi:hypothetical protein